MDQNDKSSATPIEKLEVFSAKISKATRENLRTVAKVMRVSRSEVSRRALNQYIERESEKLGITGLVKDEHTVAHRAAYRVKTKDVAV